MGGSTFDATAYAATRSFHKTTKTDPFAYTTTMRSTPVAARKVHEDLDPAKVNAAGKKVRECFDSDEHPNATPIAVLFDQTGSMADIPKLLQDKLANLFGLLLRKGYCEDPQILVGGIGDAAWNEAAPIQISQFESDNRVDENLRNIYLEGLGGGGGEESYDLSLYFLANYVDLDCLNKRGKKGYLFVIGDEKNRKNLPRAHVKQYIGDDIPEDVPFSTIVDKLKETWEVFWIYPAQASYFSSPTYIGFWKDLFGQNVLVVDDINNVCETIGTAIGLFEGAIDDLDEAADDLDEIGAGSAKGTVSSALAHLSTSGGGAITTSTAPADLAGAGAERL